MLMTRCLVTLDKCPDVQPIRVGGTWQQVIAKSILLNTGKDAKESCGIDQLYAKLKSGIEGGIHAMQHVWEAHQQEEEWGFLLIDACNAFNEHNQMAMLWTIKHEWPSGARIAFNG